MTSSSGLKQNTSRRLVRLLRGVAVSAVAMVALSASTTEAAGAVQVPKATFIKGDVQAGPVGALKKLKRGSTIDAGSIVKTADGARAELTFPDGSVVRIGPASELKLDAAAFDGKTKTVKVDAEVVGGQAWAKVATLVGNDAQFKVKTQNAVAGVRGTVFCVNVDEDATVVKVYNGSVAVGGAPAYLGSTDDACKANPIKCNRKPIAAPMQEVDVKQFEHLLGAMMKIRIGAGGAKAAAPEAFTAEQDAAAEPEWIRWNNARDTGTDAEKSD
jgi:hypothetical protein